MDWRHAEGNYNRLAELAVELIRLQLDLLVARGGPAALAAKRATGTVPVRREDAMITIMFHMTVKAGREGECAAIAKDMMATTRAQDRGCINYTIYRRADNPRELMLYEQWQDIEALNAHVARLRQVFGPPDDQEPYPETHHRRRLPKAFLALFEKTDAVRYDALE